MNITLNVNCSSLTVGTGSGVTLQLNDTTNAAWTLTTGGYQLGFNNNNGGSYSDKMCELGGQSAPGTSGLQSELPIVIALASRLFAAQFRVLSYS